MATRALIGTESPGGRYLVRRIHCDGNPRAVVPTLCAVVHRVYGGDLTAAVVALTATHWSSLRHPAALTGPGEPLGTVSATRDAAYTGRLADEYDGDQEWAYLFSDHRIHGYVMVHRPRYRLAFVPVACWFVHDLPTVPGTELAAVQRAGQCRRLTGTGTMEQR